MPHPRSTQKEPRYFPNLAEDLTRQIDKAFDQAQLEDLDRKIHKANEMMAALMSDSPLKHMYEDSRSRAIKVLVNILLAPSPEKAKAVLDEKYHELRLCSYFLNRLIEVMRQGESALAKVSHDPTSHLPEN